MSDPFRIEGPAVISFSGGRTSGYMLWRILQAHGGTLPNGVLVCFANTGREMPATLDFVQECGSAWGVRIRWLEYRHRAATEAEGQAWRQASLARIETRLAKAKTQREREALTRRRVKVESAAAPGFVWSEEVSHNSASRQGEPFEALIYAKRFLPNPVSRFCTSELKIRTVSRWCAQEFGAEIDWLQVVGLRADEPQRVERMMDPSRRKRVSRRERRVALPLAVAGVTKEDVLRFWRAQSFDLRLEGAWQGNCDGCMLKRRSFITLLAVQHPERAAWWSRMEDLAAARTSGSGARFRKDWAGGYRAIIGEAADNPRLPDLGWPAEDGLDHARLCDPRCSA